MAGVNVPLVSIQHQYLITDTVEGVTPGLPTLRDPDRLTYWKEEVGGLVMGGYEPNPIPWGDGVAPQNFAFQLLDENWITSRRQWNWRSGACPRSPRPASSR